MITQVRKHDITVKVVEKCRWQIQQAVGRHHVGEDAEVVAEQLRIKAEATGRYTHAALQAMVRIAKAEHLKNQKNYRSYRF